MNVIGFLTAVNCTLLTVQTRFMWRNDVRARLIGRGKGRGGTMTGARVVLRDRFGNLVDLGADDGSVDELLIKAYDALDRVATRGQQTPMSPLAEDAAFTRQAQWAMNTRDHVNVTMTQHGSRPPSELFRPYPPQVPQASGTGANDETAVLPIVPNHDGPRDAFIPGPRDA